MSKENISNGQSANNVEVKDMSPKVNGMDMKEFAELQRKFDDLVNANNVILSAKIRNKEVILGKEIVDKKTGTPEIGADGSIKRYANRYIVTLLFQGGSLDYKCSEEMYVALDLNSTYQFKGYMGVVKDFGKDVVSPIFQSYDLVM